MFYWSTEHSQLLTFDAQCPLCGGDSVSLLTHEVTTFMFLFIFWLWFGGSYHVTCGNCHQSYKLPSWAAKELLQEAGLPAPSYIKRNIASMGIVFGIISILVTVL